MKQIKIIIETIDKNKVRYPTVGDYFYDGDVLKIWVADMGNEDMNFLVCLHELIEEYLTKKRGITEHDIMQFDLMFEAERDKGLHTDEEEPGWDSRSPYKKEHAFAEAMERLMANELGVDWSVYNETVINFDVEPTEKIETINAGENHILHRIENERQENIS